MLLIKALFFDLDGTLLTTDKRITPKTRGALTACRDKDIKLFIATARPPLLNNIFSANSEDFALFDGGIYQNGGCVEHDGQKVYDAIPSDIVDFSIETVNKFENFNILLQMEDERHAFRYGLDEAGFRIFGVSGDKTLTLKNAHDYDTIKILVFTENLTNSTLKVPDEMVKILSGYVSGRAKMFLTDNDKVIQIVSLRADKMSSIEQIRLKLNLDVDEIAVFGDDVNDIEMLSAYPYSFAMGNAADYIKAYAKYITLDNDSDGVYHALKNMLKII